MCKNVRGYFDKCGWSIVVKIGDKKGKKVVYKKKDNKPDREECRSCCLLRTSRLRIVTVNVRLKKKGC